MPKKAVKTAAKASAKKTAKKSVQRKIAKATKTAKVKRAKKAGRPKGSGKYGCETKAVRIPAHLVKEIQAFIARKIKSENK